MRFLAKASSIGRRTGDDLPNGFAASRGIRCLAGSRTPFVLYLHIGPLQTGEGEETPGCR
jgi:hypothetical protein